MPMDYQVLARKWRPQHFADMIGQEPILRMLTNTLEQKRLHHAYLFTGTRGVGKTTLGRILAKCLNCETGVTPTPCGTCHACQAIDAGKFLDLYEIDAASRTKVEDTRDLLENVVYPPTQGRYKIYLIDEVHMLSNHSFNALLKTLEEPPEHVKFFLATTDPKRLPITILSRCLQFHLRRITPEQITGHLQHICGVEQINYELPALEILAKAADGSMRDALSLLDQAIAYGHGSVNKQEVHAMLGCMAQDDLIPLLQALAQHDGQQLFTIITHLAERAPDFMQVLEELITLLHKMAIAQLVPGFTIEEPLASLAKQLKPEDIQLYYQIALLGRRDLGFTPSPQQGFEMVMLRMLAFKPASLKQPLLTTAAPVVNTAPIKTTSTTAPDVNNAATDLPEWRDILGNLGLSGMAYALAANCTLSSMQGDKVQMQLSANHQPMLNAKLKERIEEALGRYLKKPIKLDIEIVTVELNAPLKQQQDEKKQALADAKQTLLNDPKVQQLIDMYDATLDVSVVS